MVGEDGEFDDVDGDDDDAIARSYCIRCIEIYDIDDAEHTKGGFSR